MSKTSNVQRRECLNDWVRFMDRKYPDRIRQRKLAQKRAMAKHYDN